MLRRSPESRWQEFELGDVGVLKFVNKDVLEAFLQLAVFGRIVFEQRHGFGDEAVQAPRRVFPRRISSLAR